MFFSLIPINKMEKATPTKAPITSDTPCCKAGKTLIGIIPPNEYPPILKYPRIKRTIADTIVSLIKKKSSICAMNNPTIANNGYPIDIRIP